MVMYQLNEYRFKEENIFKTSNFELKVVDQGDFQARDKTEGFTEILNETIAYITIGTTCYVEIEKYGEKKWIQRECANPGLYTEFIPQNDTLMDLGIKATPELVDGKGGRPTAYLIDNGGSENLSPIEDTDFYKDLFLDDEGPGIPQRFRIRYWINATNFRLMDLVLSFYIPSESVANNEEFGVKEGGFVDVTTVMEFRPLTERISDIKPPYIATPIPITLPSLQPVPTAYPPTVTPIRVKPTVIFSGLQWDTAQVQTAIAMKIVRDGYGYPVDSISGPFASLFDALIRGYANVAMEIWLPAQLEPYNEAIAQGTITRIGKSLEDHWQSAFIIPNYTAEANPGLKTPADLKDYYKLFVTPDSKGKGRLVNCIPGLKCEKVNQKKIVEYGLKDTVQLISPGSEEALNAMIRTAFEKKEDILFYYWGPTTLSNDLKNEYGGYTLLEEPAYTEECWATNTACAYALGQALIVMHNDLVEQAPDLVDLFTKWDFNANNQLAAEGYMADSGADYAEVADWFLKNTDDWKNWVTMEAKDKILSFTW
jgi:ABC-type proline/glycine betaine transport system substrate-binding protein